PQPPALHVIQAYPVLVRQPCQGHAPPCRVRIQGNPLRPVLPRVFLRCGQGPVGRNKTTAPLGVAVDVPTVIQQCLTSGSNIGAVLHPIGMHSYIARGRTSQILRPPIKGRTIVHTIYTAVIENPKSDM